MLKFFDLKEIFILLVLLIIFVAMFATLQEMPTFGDATSPANNYVSEKYIKDHIKDTNSPNILTSIITDYRAFDTLGETIVLFTAICAAISVLKKS